MEILITGGAGLLDHISWRAAAGAAGYTGRRFRQFIRRVSRPCAQRDGADRRDICDKDALDAVSEGISFSAVHLTAQTMVPFP